VGPPEPALGVSATSGIRKTDSQGVKWGADGLIMPAILPAAVLSGSDAAGGVAVTIDMTIAFLYFVLWLFVGERQMSEVEGSNPLPRY